MRKLAVLLLSLLASLSAHANGTLTINSMPNGSYTCVPVPPPIVLPTCVLPQVLQNGACVTPTTPPAVGTFWVYHNGVMNWGGDYSFGGVQVNYQDTQGQPLSGSFDVSVNLHGQWGGFLPFAGGTVPLWNFDSTPYNYLVFALKPSRAGQAAQVYFVKVGDVPVGIVVNPFQSKYGPAPQVGAWGVYKFAIQDQTGTSDNVFYLDDIAFVR